MENRHLYSIILFVSIISSFLVHLILGSIPNKTVGIIPDEYGFLAQAVDIVNGTELSKIVGAHQTKFIYPLAISPAFFLYQEPELQLNMVNAINSLFVSMIPIPVLLSLRELTDDKFNIVLFTVVSGFLPETMFSIGFMAEPLSLLLSFIFIYFLIKFNSSNKRSYSVTLGVLGTVMYFCKEHLVVIPIVFAMFYLFKYLRLKDNELLIDVAMFSAVFLVLTIFISLIVGTSNSYTSQLAKIVNSNLSIERIVYYLLVIISNLLLILLFVPLIVKIEEHKDLFVFFFASMLLTVLLVLVTIMLVEDEATPRFITRYHTPYIFMIIVLTSINLNKSEDLKTHNKVVVIVVVLLASFFIGDYKPFDSSSDIMWLDQILQNIDLLFVKLFLMLFAILVLFTIKKNQLLYKYIYPTMTCFLLILSSAFFTVDMLNAHKNIEVERTEEMYTQIYNVGVEYDFSGIEISQMNYKYIPPQMRALVMKSILNNDRFFISLNGSKNTYEFTISMVDGVVVSTGNIRV